MKIKVCGMKEPGNIRRVAELKPDYMGFIFWKGTKRYAGETPEQVVKELPPDIKKVGVFVDAKPSEVIDIAERYGLDMVQLHGSESPQECREVRSSIPVIKAFGIGAEEDIARTEEYEGSCDYFLLDTKTAAKGGSGRKFDHTLINLYRGETKIFLSGGLGPETKVQDLAVLHQSIECIDVNSRFENSQGIKDHNLLSDFIGRLRE